ncbi:MAG: thiamine pyrophosphate-binding protein [Acidimicrobiia bacterium]|nr:thiamine pyrophosphate-binding protein [Acidimicrobiia bacterium]
MRSGGELLVACLQEQGVSTSFGVPGESYLAVLDALHDSSIDFVTCRQEGGVGYATSAWGKLTGEPGIGFVTRGPGATNASVGLHSAMQESSPAVVFVGQASTEHLGREAFQEVDYRAFFGPLVKWATQIDHVDRIPEIISRAFSTALSGRPGPVVVALPEDVLAASSDASPGRRVRIAKPAPTNDAIDEIAATLSAAERPLLLVGGGGWDTSARESLSSFAEEHTIPVVTVFRYHDLFDNTSPCYIGDASVGMLPHVREALADADVVIAVGGRFGEIATEGFTLFDLPDAAQTIVHVHASDRELGKVVQADIPVQSAPGPFLEMIRAANIGTNAARTAWSARWNTVHAGSLTAPAQPGPLDMGEIMLWLQSRLPEDVIITNGAGNFSAWPNKHFSFGSRARLLAPQSGSMGYGLPAAIAAKVAYPERMVVCFAGDGDIQMNIQELGTAMQADAQPIVLVVNNGMYGTIRMHQERDFPSRVSGTEIVNPDYVQLGKAYGFHAERVEATEEFAGAFDRAAASETGGLLELIVPREMLTPGMSIDEMRRRK